MTDSEWLIVGRVAKPHGVHGDVLVEIITDFPERLADGVRFGVGGEDGPDEYFRVHRVRTHKGRWLLSVSGIRDRDTADEWRGRFLYLPAQARDELPPGYYYEHELTGLECRSRTGEALGKVVGIESGAGQTRLVVSRAGREHLVPFVPQIAVEVDLERGVVVLDPPPGLLDDDSVTA